MCSINNLSYIKSTSVVRVKDPSLTLPEQFELFDNYPNPFNPSTTIRYQLPKESHVSLKVMNTLGQVVATLVNHKQNAGTYQVQWNSQFPSGVYFYQLQTSEVVQTKKMLLLR
ncbi:MAG: T9SS type A sorting domain-containing protein [bacterium]